MIWSDFEGVDGLHCCGASVFAVDAKPFLDVLPIVGDASGDCDGIIHKLHGNRAEEMLREIRHGWICVIVFLHFLLILDLNVELKGEDE